MSVVNFERGTGNDSNVDPTRAFHETRDPGAMYIAASQQRALQGLARIATCGRSGIGLLTGQPGLGKTLLRSALHHCIREENCEVVSLENALLGFDDLLLEILSQLRNQRILPAEIPSRYERLAELKALLISQVLSAGKHLILLLDEADQMDTGTLDAIGALNNLSSENRSFVIPIIFGHDSVREKLAQSPALRQRIGAHHELAPYSPSECRAYIEHRLAAVGCREAEILAPGASERIHALTGGVPRVINALCRLAIQHARAGGNSLITPAILDECRLLLVEPRSSALQLQFGR